MAERRSPPGPEALKTRRGARPSDRHWNLILALGLVFGPLGCTEPISPDWSTESYLGLYGVLLAGSDTASVIARRGIEGSTSHEAVIDGQLSIVAGDETTWLIRENPDLPGCVRLPPHSPGGSSGERDCFTGLLPGPVSVQGTYRLRLLLASGDSAVGETTVPAPPEIHSPGPGERWIVPYPVNEAWGPLKVFPMQVEVMGLAAELNVLGGLVRVWGGGEAVDPRLCDTRVYAQPVSGPGQESFDAFFYGAGCSQNDVPIAWDSLDLALTAVTYDENYSLYRELLVEGEEISRTGAGFGLEGASGVFGSASVSQRIVRVVVVDRGG